MEGGKVPDCSRQMLRALRVSLVPSFLYRIADQQLSWPRSGLFALQIDLRQDANAQRPTPAID